MTNLNPSLPGRIRFRFIQSFLALCFGFTTVASWGHGGRHSEAEDQRDAGWLTRHDRADLVFWGIPKLDDEGRVRFEILETLKGLPVAETILARPVSIARAKSVGTEGQLIFLFGDDDLESTDVWHWSIGRHDATTKAPSFEEAKAYLSLMSYTEPGKCTPMLLQILAGITYGTPDWQSKIALLDAFALCRPELPKLTKTGRNYLRAAQRRHQSGQKKAAPGPEQ